MRISKKRIELAILVALAALVHLCITPASAAVEDEDLALAKRMVRSSEASGGICAVLGRDNADLGIGVAAQGSFIVHCLAPNQESCSAMRESIKSEGLYGTVSAVELSSRHLPYTQNLVNVLIIDQYPVLKNHGFALEEVLRAMAPLGTAYIGGPAQGSADWVDELKDSLQSEGVTDISAFEQNGRWVRFQKPWPSNIDDWTHFLHSANGNPVAQDTVVGPARHFQWKSGPMWMQSHETDSSISTLVSSRGRLFYICNRSPISLAGMNNVPDKWFLVARDAFNGVELWDVPIRRWGWREWKESWFTSRPGNIPFNLQKRLISIGNKVYVTLGYSAPVSQLDARTGEILKTYDGTEKTCEILYVDGTLVLSVLAGDGVKVMTVDASTGEKLWETEKTYDGTTVDYFKRQAMRGRMKVSELDPTLNTATDGESIAFIDGPDIVCLDFKTGREKWRSTFPLTDADLSAGGINNSEGNLWLGTMIVKDGVVLHASPSRLAAFSADSGEHLWSQPKKYLGHLWYEWKDVFVINGLAWSWSAELDSGPLEGSNRGSRWPVSVNGYDLHSGEVKKEVSLGRIFKTHHHHRCYRNKATPRFILASRRGTEYVNLHGGPHVVDNWVRGICHLGMMPANGLHYAPTHPCVCYSEEKLRGFNALAPARPERYRSTEELPGPKLQRGPAFGDASGPKATAEDWPAFRHNSRRTGSVKTELPGELERNWRVDLGTDVSAPTIAAGKAFVALIDKHQVVCLSADSGRRLWTFTTGGRVDSPPTYHNGAVIFGSADGCVYCVRASDGALVWRFRGAPGERLVGAFGQLESAWPVHGSVLIHDGTVYFAAGRSSHLDGGIHLYGLDARTGKVLHERTLQGPTYTSEGMEQNYGLPMGMLPDVLMTDGSKIYMNSEAFTPELEETGGKPEMVASNTSMLDSNYFKRTPWKMAGEYGRLIVHDNRNAYYVRMFDTLRGLDPSVYFVPGGRGYMLFAKNMQGENKTWLDRIPVRIRAMALASDHLLVAGPPDVVDPDDPLGAFEGRKGGLLYVFDASKGEKLNRYEIPSPPVFNGTAAARGRFYMTCEDGSMSCYGGE